MLLLRRVVFAPPLRGRANLGQARGGAREA
jgi:hypothetical protein